MKGQSMKTVRARNRPLLEPLENRLLCKIVNNGEFAHAPGSMEVTFYGHVLARSFGM